MALSPDDITRLRELVSDATFTTRFSIEHEIGVGGMGRVFVGTEKEGGRRIAIKLLDPRLQGDPERFAAEAAMLERLEHPAIVAYVAHGLTSDGRAYLAMAWLEGEPLSERLARGPLPLLDAVRIGTRIAGALAYLHERGIVHRDIKPSNVFLVGKDPAAAVVIDLGIAKQLDASQKLTRTGQLIGTPGYMAPEQVMGEATIDGKVDIFALGCLMHEAIAGEMPFPGEAVMEVLARLLLHDPKRLDAIDPEVPARLAVVVSLLLAKEASARTLDAATVERELAAIAAALETGDAFALAESPFKAPVLGTAPTLNAEPVTRRELPPVAAPVARGSRVIPVIAVFAPVVAVVLIGVLIVNARSEAPRSSVVEKIAVLPVGPTALPIEAIVTEKPAAYRTGHIVALEDPQLIGVDMAVAAWCEEGERAVAVGADGRIYSIDHATVTPKVMSARAVILDPGSAVVTCVRGRGIIVAAGRLFAIERGAILARDDIKATLPANVVDAVAIGDTARFVAPGGVWEWDGGTAEPKKLFDACGDPRRLSPDGERVACRRNGEIVVDARGTLEHGPKGQSARWFDDGKTLIVDQGTTQVAWRLGTPPERADEAMKAHHVMQVGPWLVGATGKTIERRAITRTGRLASKLDVLAALPVASAIKGPRYGAIKLPANVYDLLAVLPASREVLVNCEGRLRFVAFERAELAAMPRPARVMALAFDPAGGGALATVDEAGEVAVHGAPHTRTAFPERAEYVPTGARLVWRDDGTLVLGGSLMLDAWARDGQHRKIFEGNVDTHGVVTTTGPIAGTDDFVRASKDGIEIANIDGGAARSLTTVRLPDFRAIELDRAMQYALLDSSRTARIVKLASPTLESVVELAALPDRSIVALALVAGDPPAMVVADSFENVFVVDSGKARPLAKLKPRALAAPASGRRVAIGAGRDVIVFDVDTGAEVFRGALATPVSALAWDRGGTRLAAAGYSSELVYFDVR